MSLLQLIIIATLQGFTEWLPISSSAHVLLASGYFGLEGRDELLINAVSNLGTLAAMLVYFRKDVASAVVGGFELAAAPVTRRPLSSGARLALCILVATPFALVVAALYETVLPAEAQDALRSAYTVAGATIFFGALLWWADARGARNRTEADMTVWHAILIGATQAIAAIIPGTSRSGITMTAARALGYERAEAARFSMLICRGPLWRVGADGRPRRRPGHPAGRYDCRGRRVHHRPRFHRGPHGHPSTDELPAICDLPVCPRHRADPDDTGAGPLLGTWV